MSRATHRFDNELRYRESVRDRRHALLAGSLGVGRMSPASTLELVSGL